MGRPPKGDRAMSSTERVHAWRARQAGTKCNETKPQAGRETKPETKPGEAEALRARIAELTAERDAALAADTGGLAKGWRNASAKVMRLEKELAASRAANGLGSDAEAAMAQVARERDEALKGLAKAEALLAGDETEVAKLYRQLKAAQTTARTARRDAKRETPGKFTRSQWTTIQKALGASASDETRSRAHQLFNDLFPKFRD